jgi:6-pyruvoyltetrahydropterin/6-carboxytetrahydropterin synthase
MSYKSTKILELGSCAFRQWRADHSHCKYIHGYRLVAKFWFAAHYLDEKNWVVDFGGLKELKQVLEKQFDHTLCVSADDPLLEQFKALHASGAADLRIMEKGVGIERVADWCFDVADAHVRGITSNRCWVEKVEVWEHEKNSAIYVPNGDNINPYVATDITQTVVVQPNIVTTPNEPLTTSVGAPSPAVVEAVNANNGPRPASVGNKTTTGYGNPFGGTSWGA